MANRRHTKGQYKYSQQTMNEEWGQTRGRKLKVTGEEKKWSKVGG
jgi:hypothetical protein